MKHNWEYRPFAKILKTITPTSKIEKSEYQTRGLYPIISQEDVFISGFWDNSDDITRHSTPVVIFGDHSRVLKYIDFEFVVGADGVKIIQPIGSLNAKFLYHFLKWYNVPSLGYSRHFKLLKDVNYPVPPMETQEQIVAELDQINDLIAKNRELLSQLDALAQSLFYDIFGDPISNPKGWVARKFNDIIKLKSGNPLPAKNIVAGIFPVYGGNGIVGFHNESNLNGSNIIIGRVGALCGNVRLVKGEIFVTDNAFITEYNGNVNLLFLERLLTLLNLRQYANAAAQPVISNISLKNILVILPPLALQEDFAAKVEAIEAQKAKIEAVIAELQTLLDARMDYWFN